MISKLKAYVKGLVSHVPGLEKILPHHNPQFYGLQTKEIDNNYPYSVWLRHLVMLNKFHLPSVYETVVEIGPGDSLGVGHMATLTGTKKYIATDIIDRKNFAPISRADLKLMLEQKIPIPEVRKIKPVLDILEFPSFINLSDHTDISFSLSQQLPHSFADLVISQAAMEHVENLDQTIRSISSWLKVGGVSSYQVDLKSHQTHDLWNGHWTFNDLEWKVVRGTLPYLINRASFSEHLDLHKKHGLRVIGTKVVTTPSTLSRKRLAKRFKKLSEEDMTVSSAYICAIKL